MSRELLEIEKALLVLRSYQPLLRSCILMAAHVERLAAANHTPTSDDRTDGTTNGSPS